MYIMTLRLLWSREGRRTREGGCDELGGVGAGEWVLKERRGRCICVVSEQRGED
jgi:hypothetical protein